MFFEEQALFKDNSFILRVSDLGRYVCKARANAGVIDVV